MLTPLRRDQHAKVGFVDAASVKLQIQARVKKQRKRLHSGCGYWPKADMTVCAAHVRSRGQSRHHRLRTSAFAVAIGGKADMPFCTAYVR